MNDYIVTWYGTTGVAWRNGLGGYMPVMFLHCSEDEARLIATDLSATWIAPVASHVGGVSLDLGMHRQNPDGCPVDCEHARYYGLPEEVIDSVTDMLQQWQRK